MIASKRSTSSDLAKVDAHVVGESDHIDIPELSEADFARGIVMLAGKPMRGRPRLARPNNRSACGSIGMLSSGSV